MSSERIYVIKRLNEQARIALAQANAVQYSTKVKT
jgi:GAF domain-containing protein